MMPLCTRRCCCVVGAYPSYAGAWQVIRYFVLLFGRYVTYAWQGVSINVLCLFIKLLLTHVCVQEYGNELDYVGRHEEALVAIDRAIAIDPNTSVRYHFRAWTLTGMLTCIS